MTDQQRDREPVACPTCGQAAWRVTHGPRRNYTIEPRADMPIEVARLRSEIERLQCRAAFDEDDRG